MESKTLLSLGIETNQQEEKIYLEFQKSFIKMNERANLELQAVNYVFAVSQRAQGEKSANLQNLKDTSTFHINR